MKKPIWASVLMFASAVFTLIGYLVAGLYGDHFLQLSRATRAWTVDGFNSYFGVILFFAFSAVASLIVGGIFHLKHKERAYYYCTIGAACSSVAFILSQFIKLLSDWSSADLICINLFIILSLTLPFISLILASIQEGFTLLLSGLITKKTIWASAIMFVSAAFAFVGYHFLLLNSGIQPLTVRAFLYFSAILFFAFGAVLFLIFGGMFHLRHKKFAYHYCTIGAACSSIAFILSQFIKLLSYWSSADLICMNLFIILSLTLPFISLILAPKQKGFMLLYLGLIASSCGTTLLIGYSIFKSMSGSGIAVGFIILGFLALLFPELTIIRAIRGKEINFEMVILGLLFQIVQFLLTCTLCGVEINAYVVLLGIGSVIPATIGGILINDSIESGFALVAFGIIFFLAWLIWIWWALGISMFLGAVLTVAGVIIYVIEAFFMRNNKNIKITKSI